MKHTDSSFYPISSQGWRLLGEFKLPVKPNTDHTVGKWLVMILSPYDLPADFLNKVLKSAEEAATRAINVEPWKEFEHLHVLVFAPLERAMQGQALGFFRIEKLGAAAADHSIEFYLYLE